MFNFHGFPSFFSHGFVSVGIKLELVIRIALFFAGFNKIYAFPDLSRNSCMIGMMIRVIRVPTKRPNIITFPMGHVGARSYSRP